ncbi:Small auxin-up RNA [Dillenia turbinata]|uniref:Small auxin-up RNA n=1 Tax=Dillenia turbinata TaxID=194707 RepID=A0AAN8WCD5_9MAGN
MRHLWRKFSRCSEKGLPRDVPPGHLAVNVGEAGRRFIIKADYLNLPVFRKLLDQAYQEYGLHQDGPLSLPCDEFLFEEIIQSLKCGMHARKCSCHVVNEKQGLSLWNDSMPLLKEFPRSPAYQRQSCKWQGQTTQQMYAYAFSKTCIAVKVKGNDDERLCKTIIWFSNKKLVTNSRGTYHLREAPHSSCNHMVMDPRYRLFRKVSNEIGWYGERCRNDFDHNKALSIGILKYKNGNPVNSTLKKVLISDRRCYNMIPKLSNLVVECKDDYPINAILKSTMISEDWTKEPYSPFLHLLLKFQKLNIPKSKSRGREIDRQTEENQRRRRETREEGQESEMMKESREAPATGEDVRGLGVSASECGCLAA